MISKQQFAVIRSAVDKAGEIRPVMRGIVARIAAARGYIAPVWEDGMPASEDGLDALGDEVAYWTCEELGDVYQRLLAKDTRAAGGVYYTPAAVARWMAVNAINTQLGLDRQGTRFAVCDPACGAGIFLAMAVGYLGSVVVATAEEPDPSQETIAAWVADHAADFVYGVDVDPVAVDLAKAGLWLEAAGRRAITWLDDNIICGNTLHEDLPPALEKRLTDDDTIPIVIGNPPFSEKGKGASPWIEARGNGDTELVPRPALDDFRTSGNGRHEFKLSSLYVFFWRWALWLTLDQRPGTVALLTPKSYTIGPAYIGMRRYLRQQADRGWIVDLSPDGHRAPKDQRTFPEIATPLCIGIVTRGQTAADTETPAVFKYAAVKGGGL